MSGCGTGSIFPNLVANSPGSAGAADPWTYVVLAANVSAPDATPVAALSFTPTPGKAYIVEGFFLLRTSIAATGSRPGVSWPTGLADGTAYLMAVNTTDTAEVTRGVPAGVTNFVATAGLPDATQSWPSTFNATFETTGATTGDFTITIQSEAGAVTMQRLSWIRYRELVL